MSRPTLRLVGTLPLLLGSLVLAPMASPSSTDSPPSPAAGDASDEHAVEGGLATAVTPQSQGWKLKYWEKFNRQLPVDDAPWVRDPQGEASPWNVDHLDDDGAFYDIQGDENFRRQLAGSDVMRKRVSFGKDDWLTVELAARDHDRDGSPEAPPMLRSSKLGGDRVARLEEPSHDGGIIVRNTRPLPKQYRIEYTLRTVDFGGKRNGSWEYDGKFNGYDTQGCKTNWPWKRAGSFTGESERCNPNFGDVRAENGFYLLSIMDYANPAPHNNVFIHNHRKVGMDMYNVSGSWAKSYAVCNPKTGEIMPYPESTANGINSIFFDGSRFRSPEIGYNEFVMPTECGVRDGAVPGATIVSAAEIRPEVMPQESYKFAIERDETGYTVEMTGNFRHVGQSTFRYHRDFVQDGRPIWHYNQTPEEYDGAFNTELPFTGPFGSYTREQWPSESAYPDSFIIGDPHINYYEGSATIDDLKFYVRKGKQAP